MHERTAIEKDLKREAERISADHNGAPTLVIVGGKDGDPKRTMLGSSLDLKEGDRLRDLLGTLEVTKQIETLKHFRTPPFD